MDVVAVEAAARRAVHAVRESRKPYFLECRTYRLRAHSMFDPQLYRDKAEVETRRKSEPILRFERWLQDNHMIHPDEVPRIEGEIDAEIAEAVAFAEAAPGSRSSSSPVSPMRTLPRSPGARHEARADQSRNG